MLNISNPGGGKAATGASISYINNILVKLKLMELIELKVG
jgi:hypothetical protein